MIQIILSSGIFDWETIFKGEQPFSFLFEIIFRTLVMFIFLLVMLKLQGKRGVKQLSVFDLAILIALGSATGDPMFYEDVPLMHGIVVLIVVILLYKIITFLTARIRRLDLLVEGKPLLLLEDGKLKYKNYKSIKVPYDKFYGELRMRGISHLGQVKRIYLETTGELSIYMYEKKSCVPGLPIYPELIENPIDKLQSGKIYACIYCGEVTEKDADTEHCCSICENKQWLEASTEERVDS